MHPGPSKGSGEGGNDISTSSSKSNKVEISDKDQRTLAPERPASQITNWHHAHHHMPTPIVEPIVDVVTALPSPAPTVILLETMEPTEGSTPTISKEVTGPPTVPRHGSN